MPPEGFWEAMFGECLERNAHFGLPGTSEKRVAKLVPKIGIHKFVGYPFGYNLGLNFWVEFEPFLDTTPSCLPYLSPCGGS